MTDLRTAAQQALEALENVRKDDKEDLYGLDEDIAALRSALAQQTQTPCDIAEDGVCEALDCCRNLTK
jgi:hypothetical protein